MTHLCQLCLKFNNTLRRIHGELYRVTPKLPQDSVKSHWSPPVTLDLFVKLQNGPIYIILSVGTKYSMYDQLVDVNKCT